MIIVNLILPTTCSNVKWLEAGGVQVVPIIVNGSLDQTDYFREVKLMTILIIILIIRCSQAWMVWWSQGVRTVLSFPTQVQPLMISEWKDREKDFWHLNLILIWMLQVSQKRATHSSRWRWRQTMRGIFSQFGELALVWRCLDWSPQEGRNTWQGGGSNTVGSN